MTISRRDFIKLFGMCVASLLLTRCQFPAIAACYAPMPPPELRTARGRLRAGWRRFNELAQATAADYEAGDRLSQQLASDHRLNLDELVANGELFAAVADLVQEAYSAALYHVWRSNAPITCYEPVIVNYAPSSAGVLVQQSEALNQAAAQGEIAPETLAKAQAALEHDMAFYALSDADLQALYDRLIAEWQTTGQSTPSFDAVELEITPDAKAAAQFIVDLLAGK
jgi:hypothetical protein